MDADKLPAGWRQVLGTPTGMLDNEPTLCEWERGRCRVTLTHSGLGCHIAGKINATRAVGWHRLWDVKAYRAGLAEALADVPRVCAALDALESM